MGESQKAEKKGKGGDSKFFVQALFNLLDDSRTAHMWSKTPGANQLED
jgi:hypothetical protein